MGATSFESMGRRVPKGVWLGLQISMVLLVGGNHTSSSKEMSWNKLLKCHLLRGPLLRRIVLRAFMLMLAVIVLYLTATSREARLIDPLTTNSDECPFGLLSNLTGISNFARPLFGESPASCKERENLTKAVFEELMEKNFLQSDARVLCVGERSASAVLALRHLGFFNAFGVDRHPFFSLLKRRFVYELSFEDNHFDFVLSEDLDRVSIPALLVLEMERVLRPGGTGAMLVAARGDYTGAARGFFKSSDVVYVCRVGSFNVVVFKKRPESFASFEHFQLPASCPCIENNRPFMKYIEPLGQFQTQLSYLPDSMNISSRNRLIYINLGAGEYAKASVAKMSRPYCSNHHAAFEVFIIDHKTSVLSSFVMDPGMNFVYHPALAGDVIVPDVTSDEFLSAPVDEEGFDFVRWFKETVSDGDFVVLMMKAKLAELNILVELFESGAICHVDELFLRCSDAADCGDCMNLFKSLRKSGVYVHQWLGD
ncbi:hypothetical protein C2S52_017249 [Perilla frutescens var. hirtella]|nr:hypothetical protein C2S52_017249 [Perilla frutescens var. hirtella]KAH6811042.1 hypothetical protein C2S51_024804 [Perilla frutescens var. frutescens]